MRSLVALVALPLFAVGTPDWCKWVPYSSLQYVADCAGYSGHSSGPAQTCASWCEWVPSPSWSTTTQCSKCSELFPTPSANDFAHDDCASWCQYVSRPAWQYAPDCQTCEQEIANAAAKPAAATVAKSKAGDENAKPEGADVKAAVGIPDWCKWVPYSSLQYVADCAGYSGHSSGPAQTCASWCEWVPSPSWSTTTQCSKCSELFPTPSANDFAHDDCASWCQYVSRPAWQYAPDCQTCEQEIANAAAKPAAATVAKSKAGDENAKPEGADVKAAVGIPDWCKWVPYSSLQYVADCAGYSGHSSGPAQTCASWCEWVPSPSWSTTTQCSKCSELFPTPSANDFAHDDCASWCQYVSRPAWQYAPDCQTCEQEIANAAAKPAAATVAKSKAGDENAKPEGGLKLKSSFARPDWCKWVPWGSLQYVPDCNGSWGNTYQGAYCASWCRWVPSPSWQYTPECLRCYSVTPGVATRCASWCEWVSRPAWANTPECTQCSSEQDDSDNTILP